MNRTGSADPRAPAASREPPFAEVITVGAELLDGEILNGNAAWLGQRLAGIGVPVRRVSVVGDDLEDIAAAVSDAAARAPVVLVTGGLGPTQDDLTREALARSAGVELRRDPAALEVLAARLGAGGRVVPEMNLRQADVPAGAGVLPNRVGSAPGLRMALGAAVVYALPGVPRELFAMVDDQVVADLLARPWDRPVLLTRTLHTVGLWESAVATALAPFVQACQAAGNPTVAFLAAGGQTRVRITARGADPAAAQAVLADAERAARAALGPAVYGTDGDTLPAVVLTALAGRRASLAVAESLTGGLLAARITEVPGASEVFRGGVVAYATEVKSVLLGVGPPIVEGPGVVSAAAAEAMATGVRDRLGASYGLALTGVAGPAEQEGHPPGTVFLGLAGPADLLVTRRLRLPGERQDVRVAAVVSALDLLRRQLTAATDQPGTDQPVTDQPVTDQPEPTSRSRPAGEPPTTPPSANR